MLSKNYVYIEDKDILLEIRSLGKPQATTCTVHYAEHTTHIRYKRCDEAKVVNGLARLVVVNAGEVVSVQSPKLEVCSRREMITTTPGMNTGFPILMHSNLFKTHHLLWDVEVAQVQRQGQHSGKDIGSNNEDDVYESSDYQDNTCEDVAGYTCTPLAKAYDILNHLVYLHLTEQSNGHLKSGMSSRFFADITKHNGEMCAATCRQMYERSLVYKRQVQFVWDLVACDAEFEALLAIHDSSVIENGLQMEETGASCIIPRLLSDAIKDATPRTTIYIDWFQDVY